MNSNRRKEPRCCPRCRSDRVHRSHRRTTLDHILHAFGAEIRRCRACRHRHAGFVRFSVPLGEPETLAGVCGGILVMGTGFLVCLLFVWWIVSRFTELSG